MSGSFTRTPSGLVSKWQFHAEPTIWVEGPEDILVYAPIVQGLDCRMEPMHGRRNADALINGLLLDDLPYVVVVDGDYDVLSSRLTGHRRVLRLARHSCENYLWEASAVNRACQRCAGVLEVADVVSGEMKRVADQLFCVLGDAVVADVAAQCMDPAPDVLPDKVDMILVSRYRPEVCGLKVGAIMDSVRSSIDPSFIERSGRLIALYLEGWRFVDILRGHILFGVLSRVFTTAVRRLSGKKTTYSNDVLMQLLADAVWAAPPSIDHEELWWSVRCCVQEVAKLREQVSRKACS